MIKKALGIAMMMCAASAYAAHPAYILVYNNTSVKSTMRVTTGQYKGTCAERIWTEPNKSRQVAWGSINLLCGDIESGNTCSADVYIGDDHDCRDHAGSKDVLIGSVTLDKEGNVFVTSLVSGHDMVAGFGVLNINR